MTITPNLNAQEVLWRQQVRSLVTGPPVSLFRFINPTWWSNIQAGTDSHDLTTQIQSAIDSGEPLMAPRGTFNFQGVTLGERTYMRGANSYDTLFVLESGSNRSAFISPLTSQSLGEFEGPTLEFFKINCNGNNQTGTCHGVEFTSASFSKATRYGSSGSLRELVIESANDSCLFVGTNRNAGQLIGCRMRYSLDHVMSFGGAYDWRIFGGEAGGSDTASGVNFGGGGAHAIFGLNMYSNATRGAQASSSCDNYLDFHGCSWDLNEQEGLLAVGHANQRIGVFGGRFLGNSASATNTYSDIKLTTPVEQAVVAGATFALGSTASKYLVEFSGSGANCIWQPSYLTSGSVPYGTAVTNDFSRIMVRLTAATSTADVACNGYVSITLADGSTAKLMRTA